MSSRPTNTHAAGALFGIGADGTIWTEPPLFDIAPAAPAPVAAPAPIGTTSDRLTALDRFTIRGAISGAIAGYGPGYRPSWAHVTTLERVGVHAIGCTVFDLRDCELGFIRAAVVQIAGLA